MKKIIVILIIVVLTGCGRWKTSKLKPDPLCSISPGDAIGNVMLKYDEDDILNISFMMELNNNIYIADNILHWIQVLDKNCKPLLCIGDKKPVNDDNDAHRFSKFQFSIIEGLAVDSNGNIYVQNSFAPSQKNNNNNGMDFGFSSSYILVFDEKGTLLFTLGRTGAPDIPFNYVESLEIDKRDRLFVFSKSYDMWSVSRFMNKQRDFNANFSDTDFRDVEGDSTYTGKIEKIISYKGGDNLLISVAFYNTIDFMYRKIYIYSIEKEKIISTAFTVSNPKNELFAIVGDKDIYLWNINDNDIRFMICNLKGDVINNVSVRFPDMTDSYDELKLDDSGQFYSYHALKKGVDIIEWR